MAKKRFNIKQTLNKNKPMQEELQKKVLLPKKIIQDDEVKKKVKAIEKPKKVVRKEKKTTPPKLVRLTIDTPESMHRKLKIRSIESGLSMRDYVLRLIEKSLK